MYVLDTDTLSIHQVGGESAEYVRVNTRIVTSTEPVQVSIVSFDEQVRGRLAKCAAARTADEYVGASARLHRTLKDFKAREVADFTPAAAAEFNRLKALRIRVGTMDLRIASIVLALNSTLVTRNLADFRKVPGLKVEDWTAA